MSRKAASNEINTIKAALCKYGGDAIAMEFWPAEKRYRAVVVNKSGYDYQAFADTELHAWRDLLDIMVEQFGSV